MSEIGGVFNHAREKFGPAKDLYVMLCGRFTPQQREIISKRVVMDTDLYMDILNYFIEESGHPGYKDMSLPKEFPSPVFVADEANDNNTDISIDPEIEKTVVGGTYYLSTAQDPSHVTSVYPDTRHFATALLTNSSPTLLAHGCQYANMRELRVEDVLPFAFTTGRGGLVVDVTHGYWRNYVSNVTSGCQ